MRFKTALALLAVLAAVLLSSPVSAAKPKGPIYPPVEAATHGTGLRPVAPLSVFRGSRVEAAPVVTATLPASADLSEFNPPVADQGQVGSCASWAMGYTLRGWYADKYGNQTTGGFAPMFLYAQISRGDDEGSTFDQNGDILMHQGIPLAMDYPQGPDDYTTQPTISETVEAADYKISGYRYLYNKPFEQSSDGSIMTPNVGPAARYAIEAAIAGGNPVVLGIPVAATFDAANAADPLIQPTMVGFRGLHAVEAAKYDRRGVWIQNQWGTGWGRKGWAELSWDFIEQLSDSAVTISVKPPLPAGWPAPTFRPWIAE